MRKIIFSLILIAIVTSCQSSIKEDVASLKKEVLAKEELIKAEASCLRIHTIKGNGDDMEVVLQNDTSIIIPTKFFFIKKVSESNSGYTFQFDDNTSVTLEKENEPAYIKNNSLPLGKKSLKILAIGNSYTEDSNAYLDAICEKSGIKADSLCVYEIISGGATLEYWIDSYQNNTELNILQSVGKYNIPTDKKDLKSILSHDWDIIVLQQYSGLAIYYSSFNPSLRKLITLIRQDCPNKDVSLAWHLIWACKSDFRDAPYGEDRWKKICSAVQNQINNDGIDIIIPTGTAIQNARHTSLQTDGELTRDGTHLALGVGRYIAACTWFQALIAPIFSKDILGNTALPNSSAEEIKNYKYTSPTVTIENRELCQKCAINAVIDKFNVTEIEK